MKNEFVKKLNTFLRSENYISITYCAFGKCMTGKFTIIILNFLYVILISLFVFRVTFN
jgi:hypothetical protein